MEESQKRIHLNVSQKGSHEEPREHSQEVLQKNMQNQGEEIPIEEVTRRSAEVPESDSIRVANEGVAERLKTNETHVENPDTLPRDRGAEAQGKTKKEVEFPGSEILRAKFPTPFELADAAATEWAEDGDFSSVKITSNRTIQDLARQGLRRAKQIEKKTLEHPMTEKVVTQAFTLALKANAFVAGLREAARDAKTGKGSAAGKATKPEESKK